MVANPPQTDGRVASQVLADPQASYQFAYTTDLSGNITRTDITDPKGHVERLLFNSDHFMTSDTQAFGTSLARTTTFERQVGTNLVTAIVDPLNRRTEYSYDSTGRVLTVTRVAETSEATITTYTYEPSFHQVAD
jgi:YD repeat-containing protein